MKKIMGLCQGRHNIPGVTEYLYTSEVDPLDVQHLYSVAAEALSDTGITELDLYVTGLSVALLAVVSYCVKADIALTCYHFNRDTGEYYPQPVVSVQYCPFCGQPKGNGWYCTNCGAS